MGSRLVVLVLAAAIAMEVVSSSYERRDKKLPGVLSSYRVQDVNGMHMTTLIEN